MPSTLPQGSAAENAADDSSFAPIAIVGLGCRFPKAPNVSAYWRMLLEGVDAITEVPPERWDADSFYDERPATPRKTVSRWGGFIDNIDSFDAYFFGISPREAMSVDPQQRLLLEAAWEAIENAGIPRDQLAGSRTGVFIGVCTDDYGTLGSSNLSNISTYYAPGSARCSTAGRLAFVYGLHGPAVAVDTACSSSLTALHIACGSIQRGDCSMALAGGVNIMLLPNKAIGFSQANMLSPDGHCKAFDASANGFVRGEGAGIVVLKPLARALADGDRVYAVIRATASNNDGAGITYMAPSRSMQGELLLDACQIAGISPDSVQYVEAHGTGTRVGDPVEFGALSDALGKNRSKDQICWVGSCKSNIGHLEAAAGVAGLIKAALSIYHRTIPPNLHYSTPNPAIPWEQIPFRVPTEVIPWPEGQGIARAGVNSFGISGTNVHVLLEESPQQEKQSAASQQTNPAEEAEILALSAHAPEALQAIARSYCDQSESTGSLTLQDLCYSAAVRRTHHAHRLAVLGSSRRELKQNIESWLAGEASEGVLSSSAPVGGEPRPVFLFSGIGTQWPGMGMKLFNREPVYRKVLLECDRLIRQIRGCSIIDEIERPAADSRLDRIDLMQPAIFSVQVSLASLWRSWGIEPWAVMGHSLGEIAAAVTAGALSLEDGARVACARSSLMHQTSGMGRMAAVGLPQEQVAQRLQQYQGAISIAAINSPSSCTISGDVAAIQDIVARLEAENIFCRLLKVEVACHSQQMEPLQPELASALSGLTPNPGSIPLYSTVLGQRISGAELGPQYWSHNLRQPVQFAAAIQAILQESPGPLLEVSPNPALTTPLRQITAEQKITIVSVPSLRAGEDERTSLLQSVGTLFAAGVNLDWKQIYPQGQFVPPGPYPFQRERFWYEHTRPESAQPQGGGHSGHPLLGTYWQSAERPGMHFFETALDLNLFPYLADHSVEGKPLFPAAAYIEMALAASIKLFGEGPRILRDVKLEKALFLAKNQVSRLQLVISTPQGGQIEIMGKKVRPKLLSFKFYLLEGEGASASWACLTSGTIDLEANERLDVKLPPLCADQLTQEHPAHTDHFQFYKEIQFGISFGPAFQAVQHSWMRKEDAVATIELPAFNLAEARQYYVYPALLDAFLHSLLVYVKGGLGLRLPFHIEAFEIRKRPDPGQPLSCQVRMERGDDGISTSAIRVFDRDGEVLIRIVGYQAKELHSKASRTSVSEQWLYERQWRKLEAPPADRARAGSWLLVGGTAAAQQELSDALQAEGHACVLAQTGRGGEDLAAALQDFAVLEDCRGIVSLSAIDPLPDWELPEESVARTAQQMCGSLLGLLQSAAKIEWQQVPRIFVLTTNAQPVGTGPKATSIAQSALAGMARVAVREMREFKVTHVDVEADTSYRLLVHELLHADDETEVVRRGAERYGVRLIRFTAPNLVTQRKIAVSDDKRESYRLESAATGVLDDLKLRAMPRRAPGPGEVEIRVAAVGLNFLDVLKALNMAPGLPAGAEYFGMECSGRVVAVGPGVENFQLGDEVVALDSTVSGCLRAFFTTSASSVFRKPEHLTLEQAATIPIAYQTAYYALCHLGRVQKGESVLIHSAAGGVGLAAVEIARQCGAVIFATAGTEEKREYLRSLGIEHVMNSRTLDFAAEVRQRTQGRGVDLVLNSLAGEAIPASLSLLATGGRFLEIGKRDIYSDSQIGLLPFQKNLSFFAVDLLRMRLERPTVVEALTREVAERLRNGSFQSLPYRSFAITKANDAFRYMAQGKHIGKIVLNLEQTEVEVEHAPNPVQILPDATYLVTGGLGGLGLAFARKLVQQGARHLVLMGRKAASPTAEGVIEELRSAGADTKVVAADVSDRDQLSQVLDGIGRTGPPLKGVLHAAGVLRDGTLQRLTREQFAEVFAPKVSGAWNLHHQLKNEDLDFLVLFSSAASVLGGEGQANYAAANAFLDALAHYRRSLGLPALSINWGPWMEVGMAAQADNRGNRLAEQGFAGIPVAEGTELLTRLLQPGPAQIAVVRVDWKVVVERSPETRKSPLLAELSSEWNASDAAAKSERSIRQSVLASESRQKAMELLHAHLLGSISKVLRIPEKRLDTKISLARFGMDSLMAVELKNKIENDFDVQLPIAKLLQGPSLDELVDWLSAELGPLEKAEQAGPAASQAEESSIAHPSSTRHVPRTPGLISSAGPQSPHQLIAVESEGSKPPLFWVPGGAGSLVMSGLRDLASRIGPEQPFYGLGTRRATNLTEIETVPQRASAYVELIRERQPEGPYFLMGFCLGGSSHSKWRSSCGRRISRWPCWEC